MYQPTINVVIPTYGRANYLEQLITSVRNSTPAGVYEIIVVSSDPPDTEKVRWLSIQSDIRLVMADHRRNGRRKRSLYYYTNLGIFRATKEWILVVNDDMVFDKDWYSHLEKTLSRPENSNAGMIIVASHIGDVALGCRIAIIGRTKKHRGNWKNLYLSDVSLIHRDVLRQIGYFDEKLDWYGSGADNSLAVEFLTDKDTVVEEKIRITHFIAEEHRQESAGSAFYDFIYLKRKWDKWCAQNHSQYECDLGVDPYQLNNRLKYFRHKLVKVLHLSWR